MLKVKGPYGSYRIKEDIIEFSLLHDLEGQDQDNHAWVIVIELISIADGTPTNNGSALSFTSVQYVSSIIHSFWAV